MPKSMLSVGSSMPSTLPIAEVVLALVFEVDGLGFGPPASALLQVVKEGASEEEKGAQARNQTKLGRELRSRAAERSSWSAEMPPSVGIALACKSLLLVS